MGVGGGVRSKGTSFGVRKKLIFTVMVRIWSVQVKLEGNVRRIFKELTENISRSWISMNAWSNI